MHSNNGNVRIAWVGRIPAQVHYLGRCLSSPRSPESRPFAVDTVPSLLGFTGRKPPGSLSDKSLAAGHLTASNQRNNKKPRN